VLWQAQAAHLQSPHLPLPPIDHEVLASLFILGMFVTPTKQGNCRKVVLVLRSGSVPPIASAGTPAQAIPPPNCRGYLRCAALGYACEDEIASVIPYV
jgi:hypothetical protein